MLEMVAAALSVLIAIPAAFAGGRRIWLLPIAAGPVAGVAGWSILPATHGQLLQVAVTATLLLPVAVIVPALSSRDISNDFAETVAACGASSLQTLIHAVIRPALPTLATTMALAFILALGITPMLAPLAARP